MNKTNVIISAYFFIIAVCLGAASPQGSVPIKSKMQELAAAMADVIPFLYPDPSQDVKVLSEKVKKIQAITSKLDQGLLHSNAGGVADPAMPYLADMLKKDIDRAVDGINEGHYDYAKMSVRSTVSYCVACHTRTETGAEFPLISAFTEPIKKAPWIERMEFQAATRQFEPLITAVIKELKNKKTVVSTMDLEKASRIALSISVRVKKDIARAEEVARAVKASSAATPSMKAGAEQWLKDLSAWKKEKPLKDMTDQKLIDAARVMLKESDSADTPIGGHREVTYLRASAYVHDLLKQFPDSPFISEALYIVGQSYDSLHDLGLWSMHEMYYLACIDKTPHSEIAEKCFKRYESSIVMGYSGSSGVHIPASISRHLKQLKSTATRL